ncbi:unnamed protein product [Amoebophrya sp. A120]|nr:unnamed protein product [Amoebophrya sp. A120]|eukprot:GSA120T00005246001.1
MALQTVHRVPVNRPEDEGDLSLPPGFTWDAPEVKELLAESIENIADLEREASENKNFYEKGNKDLEIRIKDAQKATEKKRKEEEADMMSKISAEKQALQAVEGKMQGHKSRHQRNMAMLERNYKMDCEALDRETAEGKQTLLAKQAELELVKKASSNAQDNVGEKMREEEEDEDIWGDD